MNNIPVPSGCNNTSINWLPLLLLVVMIFMPNMCGCFGNDSLLFFLIIFMMMGNNSLF